MFNSSFNALNTKELAKDIAHSVIGGDHNAGRIQGLHPWWLRFQPYVTRKHSYTIRIIFSSVNYQFPYLLNNYKLADFWLNSHTWWQQYLFRIILNEKSIYISPEFYKVVHFVRKQSHTIRIILLSLFYQCPLFAGLLSHKKCPVFYTKRDNQYHLWFHCKWHLLRFFIFINCVLNIANYTDNLLNYAKTSFNSSSLAIS